MYNGPIKCPKCGSQARTQGYSTTTALAVPPGYYDEKGEFHQEPDPNTTTTHWKCTGCGEEYVSYRQHGKEYQLR